MRMPTLVLLLIACGGDDQPPPAEPTPVSVGAETETIAEPTATEPPPILSADVSRVVLAQPMFEGWTVVPLAQLQREDRVVVVVWPAIAPNGEVVDDDIIGLTLRPLGESYQVLESNWSMRAGAIVEQLAGEPPHRGRAEGVPAEALATKLSELPRRFAEHVRAGQREAAVQVAIEFSRLFAFELAVESDTVSELLALHTRDARIETEAAEQGRVRARFFQGEEMVEDEVLIAREVAPGRWVFHDHERVSAGAR